jgi:two-component system cell cycle response regulator
MERADAAATLEACHRDEPDVLLVDAALLAPDGAALVSRIKRDPDLFRIAIVALAAEIGIEDALEGLRGGVHHYLVEPFSDPELVSAVRSAHRTRTLQDELMARSQQLEMLAFTDPLTGLDNRRSMMRRLAAAISGARRHGRPLAAAMLDLDHFKTINDTHGHDVGDAVLIIIAQRLTERLRKEDVVGRLGGEEFFVLLPDADGPAADAAVEALRHAVADTPIRAGHREVSVTVSAGVASWAGDDADDLLRRADTALYAAKAAGRNAVRSAPAA